MDDNRDIRIAPRARPSYIFERTLSERNLTDTSNRFFISKSKIGKRQSDILRFNNQSRQQVESLYCPRCNQKKIRCMCATLQLQRTQSYIDIYPGFLSF